MIVLKANPEMEATFQKLIQTTGERVKWNGNFVVIGNYLILHGENRSLFFNFDNRKVVSNFIELSINEDDVIDIKEYPKIQNIINMLLYAFGKWGTVKGLKVEKSESELNLLFVTILKEIGVEPDYSWLKFRFLKDGILITYEDVIQLAIEEKENPLKEMEESEQEKEGLWHSLVWKRCHRAFTKDEISEEQRNENRIGFNFYMVGYRCPRCSSHLHMIVFPEDNPQVIDTDDGPLMLSRAYTCADCGIFFTPRPELLLSEGDIYEMDFEGDQRAYEDYRELLGRRGERTTNCHFNEFVDDRQQQKAILEEMHRLMEGLDEEERRQQREVLRNVSEAELAKLIQAIPTMNDLLLQRFYGILEDGFYSDKAIKENEHAIEENVKKQKKRRKQKLREELERQKQEEKQREKEESQKQEVSSGVEHENKVENQSQDLGKRWERLDSEGMDEAANSEELERKARLKAEYEKEIKNKREEDERGKFKEQSAYDDKRQEQVASDDLDEMPNSTEYERKARLKAEYERELREQGALDGQREEEKEETKEKGEAKEKDGKEKAAFARLKKLAEGVFGKSYHKINHVIKEIEEEDISKEKKEELLPSLRRERQIRGEQEVEEFMTGLAANMDRKQYKKLAQRLKEYADIDISVYQEKLDVKRAPVEKEEIQKMINLTNLQDRSAIVDLLRRLEEEEFSKRALQPFMEHILDNLKAIDQKELDRLCMDYEKMNVEDISKLYDSIQNGNFLPELKNNALEMLSKRLARIKVEECDLLVKKLQRQMEGEISDNSRHHFYPAQEILKEGVENADTWVIDRALDTYAGSRGEFEYPILVIDTSLNKGGREGMILTPEHLFCSTLLSAYSIPISEIKKIKVNTSLLGKGITIEQEDGAKVKAPYAVSSSELKKWGAILSDFIQYLKERPQSRKIQYLAKEKHDVKCCYRCGFVYKEGNVCPECGCKSNQ